MIRHLAASGVLSVILLLAAGCGGGSGAEQDTLRVGLIPNQSPEEVEAEYQPLEEYLSSELDLPVELSVPTSYNAVVEAMTSGELDLAYFGGLTYVQARERADVHPLVTEVNPITGDTTYNSLIIVPADSDIREVEDLRGETFAFGSPSSTSGSLYPSIMLKEAGIDYRTDLANSTYTGGHDATAQAVANGSVDAGGLEDRILYDLQEEGVIDEDDIRVISESDPIEGYPWVVREALDDGLKEDLVQAFLDIENRELLSFCEPRGTSGSQPPTTTTPKSRPGISVSSMKGSKLVRDFSLQDVTVAFGGTQALDGVTLQVEPGERVAVIGPSGAGKSTLLRTLTRSVALDEGQVRVGGRDLYALSPRELRSARRGIGTIYQAYNLIPQLTVGVNAALGEVGEMDTFYTLRTLVAGPAPQPRARVKEAL